MTFNTIWKFETKRFRVTLAWDWEDSPDLSWDETGEVLAKLESGEWGNYCFRLMVECDGHEVACEYLGNSIHADPSEFRDHIGLAAKERADSTKYNSPIRYGSYFKDMMHETIRRSRCGE